VKIKKHRWTLVTLLAIWAGLSTHALAQRIYDKERDEQAKQAVKLAEEIKNGSNFEKQLRNLSILARQDFANFFLGQRRATRARINSFTTWRDVERAVNKAVTDVNAAPPVTGTELQQRIDNIKKEIEQTKKDLQREKEEAEKALKRIKDKFGAGAFADFLERVGELQSLYEVGERVLLNHALDDQDNAETVANYVKVATEIKNTLATLRNLYDSYAERLDQIIKRRQELQELEQPLKLAVLEALEVDEEHWKNMGAIAAKREADQEDLRDILTSFRAIKEALALPPGEEIEETVQKALAAKDRKRLINVFQMLHLAAALTVRGSTPHKLEQLRTTHEEHRYSIRKSAVRARTYELTVLTGVQRLALYHQGGIRPEVLAQLIHSISSVAIPPAILAK
jgi:hypothetical protein